MPLLSIAVPCHYSEAALGRCLDSLLPSRERLEVIIIHNGFDDRTEKVAKSYVARFPDQFQLVKQESGGYGSAVNAALRVARAPWFRILDSSDCMDPKSLEQFLQSLTDADLSSTGASPDLILNDIRFEIRTEKNGVPHVALREQSYEKVFRPGQIQRWADMGQVPFDLLLQMQAVTFRTSLLRRIGLVLPERCNSVDNYFVYVPLPYVERILYLHEYVYQNTHRAADRSARLESLERDIDMQLRVTQEMMYAWHLNDSIGHPNLQKYMLHHLTRMFANCLNDLRIRGGSEATEKANALKKALHQYDEDLFRRICNSPLISSPDCSAQAEAPCTKKAATSRKRKSAEII